MVAQAWPSERIQQFVKFCVVGASGLFVDMGVLFLLADPRCLGLNAALSKVCATEAAMTSNFVWNELWTFRPSDSRCSPSQGCGVSPIRSIAQRLLLFNAICGIGIVLAVLLLQLFHKFLGWNIYVANLVAILIVTLWNYGMNAWFNWQSLQARTAGRVRGAMRRATLLAITISFSGAFVSFALPAAADNVEEFKRFLEEPPAVESMLWRRVNGNVGLTGKAASSGRSYVTYQGAYSGEDFWIRQVNGTFQEVVSLGAEISLFVGRAGDTLWQVNGRHVIKSVLPDGGASRELQSALKNDVTNKNPVAIAVRTGELMFRRAANLGLFSLEPRTLQFSGDQFEARLTRGRRAKGEVSVRDGRVASVQYQIVGEDGYSVIDYTYLENPNVPPFLPTKVVQNVYTKEGKFLRVAEDFELLHLLTSHWDSIHSARLAPRKLLRSWSWRQLTDGHSITRHSNIYGLRPLDV